MSETPTPTQDVQKKAEEIIRNIEELNQQVTKLKDLVKSKMKVLDDELTKLRNITDDMTAWIKKLKTYFLIRVINEGYGEIVIKGRANEVEWIRSYGTLDGLTINKVLDDFFVDVNYFNNALKEYAATIERITHLLPGILAEISEVKQQLASLEDRISKLEDEVEELTPDDP